MKGLDWRNILMAVLSVILPMIYDEIVGVDPGFTLDVGQFTSLILHLVGLLLGAGNIGLIVAYQLLQAGASVAAIIEGLPLIGGYHVHAAKIRRLGVPILTSHTVVAAFGANRLERVEVAPVDRDWKICG